MEDKDGRKRLKEIEKIISKEGFWDIPKIAKTSSRNEQPLPAISIHGRSAAEIWKTLTCFWT